MATLLNPLHRVHSLARLLTSIIAVLARLADAPCTQRWLRTKNATSARQLVVSLESELQCFGKAAANFKHKHGFIYLFLFCPTPLPGGFFEAPKCHCSSDSFLLDVFFEFSRGYEMDLGGMFFCKILGADLGATCQLGPMDTLSWMFDILGVDFRCSSFSTALRLYQVAKQCRTVPVS